MGKTRYTQSALVGEPERKRAFERPRHRSKDNIKGNKTGGCGLGSSGRGKTTTSLEHSNQLTVSTKRGKFLD
jgi:hypothetical protein